jgi:hypothetical protein
MPSAATTVSAAIPALLLLDANPLHKSSKFQFSIETQSASSNGPYSIK